MSCRGCGLGRSGSSSSSSSWQNVADGLLYAGPSAAERYRRADEALERVGLSERANFKLTKLSGGERQRVAIARALVGRPAIVLADEPTGNLDSTTGASIMELVRELNAVGATILMITHDAGLADQLPRQIRVLDGQVVSDTVRDRGAPVDGAVAEAGVQSLLAQTANPEAPNEVSVGQPSDVLTARAAAAGAFDSLFLGLGVLALIVGAVGVANIMIIWVLERRSEIGLRRALGATKGQIRTQFLGESILLAVIGGVVGVLAGAAATAAYASSKSWAVVIPVEAWSGGIASAHPDRRILRPDAGRSSVSDAAYLGIANGMSGKW